MTRKTATLGLVPIFFALASPAEAQVRMVELDENAREVTIRNFSPDTTVDVSGYFMCRAPGTYQAASSLTIVGGGDLNLSPGEQVTLVYTFIIASGTGIGLYLNGANFGSPANMADYLQYKGVAGFRESVAVAAGLWTAGTFATGDPGPYFYTGNGSQNGAAFWTHVPAPQVPALGGWRAALVAAALLSVGLVRRRQGDAGAANLRPARLSDARAR
jgi:hypothetical protein